MLVIHISHVAHVFNILYPTQTLQIVLQYIADLSGDRHVYFLNNNYQFKLRSYDPLSNIS